MEPPSKKPRKFMEDSESDSDSDSQGGVSVAPDAGFKINEDYARRFEYNKKREERQQRMLIKSRDSFRLTYTDD